MIFHVKDRDITLVPGKPIHVTAKLLHSLRAVEGLHPAGDHADRRIAFEPKVNIDVEEVNPGPKTLTPKQSSPPHLYQDAAASAPCPRVCRGNSSRYALGFWCAG